MGSHVRVLPMAPLEEYVNAPTQGQLIRDLDTDRFQIRRWRVNGIPIHTADRLAIVRLGVHPLVIWGDHWLNVEPVNQV